MEGNRSPRSRGIVATGVMIYGDEESLKSNGLPASSRYRSDKLPYTEGNSSLTLIHYGG